MFGRYQLTQEIMLILILVFLGTSPGCGGDNAERRKLVIHIHAATIFLR